NIEADPAFARPPDPGLDLDWGTEDDDYGDLRLQPGSPCIDAGHNWGLPVDAFDLDGDGRTSELIPFDLDGNPRISADDERLDHGCGVPAVVDMGAYEHQHDPVDQVLLGDINADGAVDTADLMEILVDWGPCEEPCCLSDLDLNGHVDVDDVVALILSWG
ncbi:MAG: choice-of-anchor Q domain-containing protein, partial [Planctomycetota bacterium]